MKIDAKILRKLIREELAISAMAKDSAEGHDEGEVLGHGGKAGMAKSQLFRIAKFAQSLHDKLNKEDELPEWVQSKISSMVDDVDEIHGHLDYKLSDASEEPKGEKDIGSIIDMVASLSGKE